MGHSVPLKLASLDSLCATQCLECDRYSVPDNKGDPVDMYHDISSRICVPKIQAPSLNACGILTGTREVLLLFGDLNTTFFRFDFAVVQLYRPVQSSQWKK